MNKVGKTEKQVRKELNKLDKTFQNSGNIIPSNYE
jgi:hypothetical protein